jgi:hypothetical protein
MHPDELWVRRPSFCPFVEMLTAGTSQDAADTVMWVMDAVYERVNVLQCQPFFPTDRDAVIPDHAPTTYSYFQATETRRKSAV